jgi:hypothetical protein
MLTRWSKIAAFATIKEIQGAADAFQRAIWEYPSAEMLQECIDFFSAKRQLIREILKIDTETKEAPEAETELAEAAGLPQRLLGMTIRELVEKFHDLDGIERYVKMLRDLAEADEKDQRVQEHRSNTRDGLMDFIEKRTAFDPEALTKMEELYTAYLDHHGFDRNDAASGEILSRHRFIRLILETCGQFVSEEVARIDGKPARCFSGLKLRAPDGLD